MNYHMMKDKIESFELKIKNIYNRIKNRLNKESISSSKDEYTRIEIINQIDEFYNLNVDSLKNNAADKIPILSRRIKNLKRGIESDFSLINSYLKSINKYTVELHKKFSIPIASLVFILIGAPLGIIVRKGGFAVSMSLSLGFFIVYWAFLIAGEEFADRGIMSPILSMWLPNVIFGIIGSYLCFCTFKEKPFLNFQLFKFFRKNND